MEYKPYPEPKVSDYVFSPYGGSNKIRAACGHLLHMASRTKIVVYCDGCIEHLKKMHKKNPNMMTLVVSQADVEKVDRQAKKNESRESAKAKARVRNRPTVSPAKEE